ncbi:MAG TPA: MarR family transcriptional regulator [Acidimicrobiales bacterium]|nr:MarR family transcriptional regulator [Acidimicrobiales bacterium]
MKAPAQHGSAAWLDEEAELIQLLFDVLGTMKHRFHAIVSDFGITPPMAHALRQLDPGRAVPMRDLALGLHCDASTVTGIVDRLEAVGLVQRRPDPVDRRVKALVVTKAGLVLRGQLVERLVHEAPPVAALDHDERRHLRALLAKIVATAGGGSPAR